MERHTSVKIFNNILKPGNNQAIIRCDMKEAGKLVVKIYDSKGKEIRKAVTFYKNLIGFFYSWNILLCENFINQPSTFWKLDLWNEVKDLDPAYKAAWDYELWLNMALKSRPVHLRKNLSKFRRHEASISENNFVKQFDEELAIARKHCNFIHYMIHAFNRWKIISIYKILS